MRTYIVGVLVVAAMSAACAQTQTPAAKAAGVERMQCDGSANTEREIELLRSVRVLHFEPIYSRVPTANNDTEARVNGAKFLIRPPKGVTAEEMTRILQCHNARVLLGRVSGGEVANDPYWLPDAWVDIQVRPEDGNFAVTVTADTVRESLEVLGRAHHYADEHTLANEPELP